jgi:hypothetical protein
MLKLHELDKHRPFHQIYKLTDVHLNPTAQSTEKVNLAQPGMSHTVAASPSGIVAKGKYHCTMCHKLFSVVEDGLISIKKASFQGSLPQEQF